MKNVGITNTKGLSYPALVLVAQDLGIMDSFEKGQKKRLNEFYEEEAVILRKVIDEKQIHMVQRQEEKKKAAIVTVDAAIDKLVPMPTKRKSRKDEVRPIVPAHAKAVKSLRTKKEKTIALFKLNYDEKEIAKVIGSHVTNVYAIIRNAAKVGLVTT